MNWRAAALVWLVSSSSVAASQDYVWPLREPFAYDGDTIYITMPGLPPELADMSVRVLGIDTPEMRGQCPSEKALARSARDFTRAALVQARVVIFRDIDWDKYGGRILAQVIVDGQDLATLLITSDLGRDYAGGKREGWCPTD